MDLNALIEKKLEEKSMSKQALYKKISEAFYSDNNAKQMSYPSFLAKIAENKLTASTFFEIAEILDIDAREIQRNVKMKVLRGTKKLPAHMQGVIKKESLFFNETLEYEMINLDKESKYCYYKTHLLCIDRNQKRITLELFDFLKLNTTLICDIDFKSEYFHRGYFEEFLNMSGEEKIARIEKLNSVSSLIYPNDKHYKLVRRINIPTIDWYFDYSYTDIDDIESRLKYIYKGEKTFNDFINAFEEKFKDDLTSYVENADKTLDVDGIGIVFNVVNSAHYFSDDILKVINNIEIKSLVK